MEEREGEREMRKKERQLEKINRVVCLKFEYLRY